jgi:hypothetical protein
MQFYIISPLVLILAYRYGNSFSVLQRVGGCQDFCCICTPPPPPSDSQFTLYMSLMYIDQTELGVCSHSCFWMLGLLFQEKFPRTEHFPKISLLKVLKENFQLQNFFPTENLCRNILQNFLSAENFPQWKWAFHIANNPNNLSFTAFKLSFT